MNRGLSARWKTSRNSTTASLFVLSVTALCTVVSLGCRGERRGPSKETSAPVVNAIPIVTPGEAAPDAAEPSSTELVTDDGVTLWASPTNGRPIDLHFLPPAVQAIFVFRPCQILAHPEGARAIRALGPDFVSLSDRWKEQVRVDLAAIEQLTLALLPSDTGVPQVVSVVRLTAPTPLEFWSGRERMSDTPKLYRSGAVSFWVPEGQQSLFVMGSDGDLSEVLELGGAAPPLRKEMARLHDESDDDRLFTALVAPNFLFADGRGLFSASRQKLIAPLDVLLGDGVQASLLSLHVDEQAYAELRFVTAVDVAARKFAQRFQADLQELPERVSDYLGSVELDPHWQRVAVRFPGMVRFLVQQSRVGVESGQVVVNSVMPSVALHNLLLATELALESSVTHPIEPSPDAEDFATWSLDDVLDYRTTLVIPQQSLEFSVRDLVDQVRESLPGLPFTFRVEIVGADLQLEGITRNQQIRDFRGEQQTVAELLTALVMKANPVTTVQKPAEPDQKLVWVKGPNQNGSEKGTLLITTRAAARKKAIQLPDVFETP